MNHLAALHPALRLMLCMLAAMAFCGCSATSATVNNAATAVSSADPNAAAAAEAIHLNVVPIVYPAATLPPSTAPIPFDVQATPGVREVQAGDVVTTPCNQTIASLDGVAIISGCWLQLATQTLGHGTAADIPYFTAAGIASTLPNVDALMQEDLDAIASANAQTPQMAALRKTASRRDPMRSISPDPISATAV